MQICNTVPEGDALVGDVDGVRAGPPLVVHPDLQVVHLQGMCSQDQGRR